jgi:hypothetical protein
MQLFLHSHLARFFMVCNNREVNYTYFFTPHQDPIVDWGRWCRGESTRYVAARKLLASVIWIHGTTAKERRCSLVQFLLGSLGYRVRNGGGIKCYLRRNIFQTLNPPAQHGLKLHAPKHQVDTSIQRSSSSIVHCKVPKSITSAGIFSRFFWRNFSCMCYTASDRRIK